MVAHLLPVQQTERRTPQTELSKEDLLLDGILKKYIYYSRKTLIADGTTAFPEHFPGMNDSTIEFFV